MLRFVSCGSAPPEAEGEWRCLVCVARFVGSARCGEIQAEYGVLPLVSWGSAPPDAQREWRGLDCDARV